MAERKQSRQRSFGARRATALHATLLIPVILLIGCERPWEAETRAAEISDGMASVAEEESPELASVLVSDPTASASRDYEIARLDDSPLLISDLRGFIDRARADGYRPASLGEARRLLRAALQEKALALDAERRGYSPSDPVGIEATYQALTVELTGSTPLGSSEGRVLRESRLGAGRIERLHTQHRARIQRAAILDALLARSQVETDMEQLLRFVNEPSASSSPPRPPISAAAALRGEGKSS